MTMPHPSNSYLAPLFAAAIEQAWRGTASVKSDGTSEPNHVARFIQGTPAGIASAIKTVPGVLSVAVQGTFCHMSPYAFWQQGTKYVRRELADLLVVVELVQQGLPKRRRAMLVQAKMGAQNLASWSPTQTVDGLDEAQRYLYAALPDFCLEMSGRPNKRAVAKSGLSLSQYMLTNGHGQPYDLRAMRPAHPVGLVYAAIDRDRTRAGLHLAPWLTEDGRPQAASDSAVFSIPFSDALADLVTEPQPKFGVDCAPQTASIADWPRLIDDLTRWAHARNKAGHKSSHGVQLNAGTSKSDVYHNIQTFQVESGRLLGLMQWQHFADQGKLKETWPVALVPSRRRWCKEEISAIAEIVGRAGEPRLPWPQEIEIEESGGFGLLKIRIEIAAGRRRQVQRPLIF